MTDELARSSTIHGPSFVIFERKRAIGSHRKSSVICTVTNVRVSHDAAVPIDDRSLTKLAYRSTLLWLISRWLWCSYRKNGLTRNGTIDPLIYADRGGRGEGINDFPTDEASVLSHTFQLLLSLRQFILSFFLSSATLDSLQWLTKIFERFYKTPHEYMYEFLRS